MADYYEFDGEQNEQPLTPDPVSFRPCVCMDGTTLLHTKILTHTKEKQNKAGYTATEVACGWAEAIFMVTRPFWQE